MTVAKARIFQSFIRRVSSLHSPTTSFSRIAYQLFGEMPYVKQPVREDRAYLVNILNGKPTKYVLCLSLNSCAKTQNKLLTLQIHTQLIKTGFENNLFINTALVDAYAKCGALGEAMKAFQEMKTRDHVSWTAIITGFSQNNRGVDAVMLFKDMLSSQVKPNCFTYVSVVSACTSLEFAIELTTTLHAHTVKLGWGSNSFLVSSLIDCYSKLGRIELAVILFSETSEHNNVILMNSMISGYTQNRLGEEALKLFLKMRSENINPTDHTLTSILDACGNLAILQEGRQLHSLVYKFGSICNVFVASALVDMYSKCGCMDESRSAFDQTIEKNRILWTAMISGYAQNGRGHESLELFDRMIDQGFIPDHLCFTSVLIACNHAGLLERGLTYFDQMKSVYNLIPRLDQYGCLIDLYARKGHLMKAKEIMEEMPFEPNSVMWSSFLRSCKVYNEIELASVAANELSKMEPSSAVPYITLASIFAGAGLWNEVGKIRESMKHDKIRKGITGWSWIQIDKEVRCFSVLDKSCLQSQDICIELEKLNVGLRETGYVH
ncbi:pentatricopeptide repeat-containing protein At2g13600-like [Impatiens glandulifera]|uniref:pentatricopeptide repeat-containing protein At2g13600-like n=1 Tax=Impatiens glandulifera TaxID=253017 RepID=UPI001FB180A7|nr:pentatricopeptide repeat-containing protein At2g13600-like [Impatiens glandulifera]